jgi:hypothetical protein
MLKSSRKAVGLWICCLGNWHQQEEQQGNEHGPTIFLHLNLLDLKPDCELNVQRVYCDDGNIFVQRKLATTFYLEYSDFSWQSLVL